MRYSLGSVNYDIVGRAGLVVVTGSPETVDFCREAADLVKAQNLQLGDLWLCESLEEFEQKARVPSFFGRWWYTGSADMLSGGDKKALAKLIKDPVEHGTAVLLGTDFKKYRSATKGLNRAPRAHEISASFPNEKFLIRYVQRKVVSKGYKIAYGTAEAFVRRMGVFYTKYDYYIELMIGNLLDGDLELSKAIVEDVLKGYTGASFETFFKYLIRPLSNGNLVRSVGMFKSYAIVKEEGPASVLRRVHNKALQCMEVRRLINEGYLPTGGNYTVASFTKLLNLPDVDEDMLESDGKDKKKKYKFSYRDILLWSDFRLMREIGLASETTLADWFTIAKLSDLPYASDLEAEIALFNIMTRSRRKLG